MLYYNCIYDVFELCDCVMTTTRVFPMAPLSSPVIFFCLISSSSRLQCITTAFELYFHYISSAFLCATRTIKVSPAAYWRLMEPPHFLLDRFTTANLNYIAIQIEIHLEAPQVVFFFICIVSELHSQLRTSYTPLKCMWNTDRNSLHNTWFQSSK